eukprot:767987_1
MSILLKLLIKARLQKHRMLLLTRITKCCKQICKQKLRTINIQKKTDSFSKVRIAIVHNTITIYFGNICKLYNILCWFITLKLANFDVLILMCLSHKYWLNVVVYDISFDVFIT